MPDQVRQPTADECTNQVEIRDGERLVGYACWYPTMGGYSGKAVIVPDKGCVDVHVWHDGQFPFDGECQACSTPRQPVVLHHCNGGEYTQFGQLLGKVMGEHDA